MSTLNIGCATPDLKRQLQEGYTETYKDKDGKEKTRREPGFGKEYGNRIYIFLQGVTNGLSGSIKDIYERAYSKLQGLISNPVVDVKKAYLKGENPEGSKAM